MMKKSYWITGLKLALIQFILGIVIWFITFILTLLGVLVASVGFWIIVVLAIIALSIFIGGWLANKIWKWK